MHELRDMGKLIENPHKAAALENTIEGQEQAINRQTEVVASRCLSHLNSELQVSDKKLYSLVQFYFCVLQFPFHLISLWQAGAAVRTIEVQGFYFDSDVNDFATAQMPGIVAANNYILHSIATRFQFLYRKNAQRKWYELYDNFGQKILFESRMLRQLEVISTYTFTFIPLLILILISTWR